MAHVKVFRDDEDGTAHLVINGQDFTNEVFADGLRISATGDGEADEVCVDLKIGLGRLDIGEHENVDAALLVGSSLVRMARNYEVA